jgi:hypothetical protein
MDDDDEVEEEEEEDNFYPQLHCPPSRPSDPV